MRERRSRSRLRDKMVVQLRGTGSRRDARVLGVLLNLSDRGALLETEKALTRGDELDLEVRVRVRVRAKVTRVDVAGVRRQAGLRFVKVGLIDRWILRRYLRRKRV